MKHMNKMNVANGHSIIRSFDHSIIFRTRQGSALLIVLGMLSFMVVSAVSFSIYMRQSRAPSSYLRRNLASRYLVRAALAKAVDELEGQFNEDPDWGKFDLSETDVARRFYGVYDDPYPGRGTDSSYPVQQNGDYWQNRVFMPFGPVRYPEATVPTLTLEALAYLPPAVIDDVRVLSRRTRTAAWRSLPYECGRYAYTAVNVSDLFDINRLCSADPRDSGPHKVTLATLFAKTPDDPFDIDVSKADTFETDYHDGLVSAKVDGNAVPFVSLADFNLMAGNGSEFAPFMKYIGGTSLMLQNQSSPEAANAMFITDSIFAPPAAAGTVFDLAGAHQPFRQFNARSLGSVSSSMNTEGGVDQVFQKNLGLGIAALYDYLDSDSIPISLAIPTTEAVPMIVGVASPSQLKPSIPAGGTETKEGHFEVVNPQPAEDEPAKLKIKRTCTKISFTGFGNNIQVQALAAYPFKRMKTTKRAKNYTVRGLLRIFAAPDNMGCRPNDPQGALWPEKDVWKNGVAPVNGVATFLSQNTKTLSSFNADIEKTENALDDSILLKFNADVEMPVFWKIEETLETAVQNPPPGYPKKYTTLDGLKNVQATFRPLDAAGDVAKDWTAAAAAAKVTLDENAGEGGVTEFAGAGEYRLYASVWLQVMDGSDVVDMVPAVFADDEEWNGRATTPAAVARTLCGNKTPLLNFRADATGAVKFDESITGLDGQMVAFDGWKSLYAVDPRYNFAPEDWFAGANATVSKTEWMQLLGLDGSSSPLLGQNGRDRDIFMFVSDQGYLQSIGELQFLPMLDVMDGSAQVLNGDYCNHDFHGEPFSARTTPTANGNGGLAHLSRFWRTYTAYNNGSGTDEINPYRMTYNGKTATFQSGSSDFKLNPYSNDDRVFSAALVGTPFDYYVASTNENAQSASGDGKGQKNQVLDSIDLDSMMSTYSFGESSAAKMSRDDLLDIEAAIRDTFLANARSGGKDWATAWDNLSWQHVGAENINEANNKFFGDLILENPLHGVDRKFLYSFWRECFGNAQQLYLIFVRAEPSSIGGGAAGSLTSSQLGGRAVALVWRDPNVPVRSDGSAWTGRKARNQLNSRDDLMDARRDSPPHRTRVLFYHQFD